MSGSEERQSDNFEDLFASLEYDREEDGPVGEEAPEEVAGYVDHMIFENPSTGFKIMVLKSSGKDLVLKGNATDVEVGDEIIARGRYVLDPTYGRQFDFDSYRIVPPSDSTSMERYLGSGAVKGVGAALAARIVKEFGDDTFRIIEEDPGMLANIKGISKKKAMDIAIQLEQKRDLRAAMLYLSRFRISQALSVKIYEAFGDQVEQILQENPYRLAEEIQGVGFQTADKIAATIGIAANSEFRIRSALNYILSQASFEGHCYLNRDELLRQAMELLQVEREAILQALEDQVMSRRVIMEEDRVYHPMFYYAEENCAHLLHELNLELEAETPAENERIDGKLRRIAQQQGMEVDQLQIEAARRSVQRGVSILTGGPGTGKTTTINLMIQYFKEQDMDLLLAAPTGRAAKRMTEATGYEAATIHRLLEVSGGGEDGGAGIRFQKNEENPLEADVIIIDEMSMVDILLFQALLKAVIPGTRLILVGDASQLPSVGPGQVLRDLMASTAYPCSRLERIFRQEEDSDIVRNAHAIDRGEQIRLDTHSRDFLFLQRNHLDKIREIMVWMVANKLPEYCHCSVSEVQVLTPMRRGELGAIQLNVFLQNVLNPGAPGKQEHMYGDTTFREGDKVMQIRNNYKLEWKVFGRNNIEMDSGLGVYNGDVGRVKEIRVGEGIMRVEFDDARMVDYPFSGLDELELAYAMTVHKSQGSEYPAVVIPLLEVPHPLAYRNLLYTAITRAKSCVVILGEEKQVREMIDHQESGKRNVSLQERIAEAEGRR